MEVEFVVNTKHSWYDTEWKTTNYEVGLVLCTNEVSGHVTLTPKTQEEFDAFVLGEKYSGNLNKQ